MRSTVKSRHTICTILRRRSPAASVRNGLFHNDEAGHCYFRAIALYLCVIVSTFWFSLGFWGFDFPLLYRQRRVFYFGENLFCKRLASIKRTYLYLSHERHTTKNDRTQTARPRRPSATVLPFRFPNRGRYHAVGS